MTDIDLDALAGTYRQAVGVRDPALLPLADSVRYTENGQAIPLEKGIWATVTEQPPDYLTVADPVQQQAVMFGVLTAGDHRFLYATRLGVEAGLVTEIETLVVTKRSEIALRGLENLLSMSAARSTIREVVPPERRVSRERLAGIPHLYFDAVQADDGSIFPGAPGCVRWENGTQTAPRSEEARRVMVDEWGFPDFGELDVKGDIGTGIYRHITAISHRRIIAVDEERQIAIGAAVFEHDGSVRSLPEFGIDVTRPIMRIPFSNVVFELFKADRGQVVAIEAVGIICPSGATHGWASDPVVFSGVV